MDEMKQMLQQILEQNKTLQKDWEWSGHVVTSYNYNFNNPKSQANRLRVFDEKANTFRLNSAELNVGKPSTTESPWGFGLTLNLGTDAEKIHSAGLGLASTDNPLDIQQAFVTYKWNVENGVDFKAGKFVTLLGQEVIESPNNFNISRSLLFGFAIPFTHTGLLVSYPVVPDLFTTTVGVVNGWDNVDDNNDGKSLTWQLALTPRKNLTILANGIYGPEQASKTSPKRTVGDLVVSYKPIEPLTLALNLDLAFEDRVPLTGLTKDAYWYGVAAYAGYDLTDRLTVSLRGEYFVDEDGARTGTSAVNTATGLSDRLNLWEITTTLKIKLREKLFARLEYRHDQAAGRVKTAFDKKNGTFNRGQQDTVGVELYYQF
ncbi:MAG: porin [candidate division NC10 bacterium]|nr:porin [candidate division NC10 bacterium]MBI4842226.1 porin [candidate division NC10 bacterium]